jgi:cell filamentation protein, protein adenylyltransferase
MSEKVRIKGSPRTEQIIKMLFSNPIVRVSNLRRKLKVTYPTAQSDVNRLVKSEILFPLPNHRPKTYYAPEIMEIAYQETDDLNEPVEAPSG